MAAEGVEKAMKEEEDKVDNAEDMDVDSVDEKTAAEWVFCNIFMDLCWPFIIAFCDDWGETS